MKVISHSQAWRNLNAACEAVGVKENVGTHTLRKIRGTGLGKVVCRYQSLWRF
jgi:hypothetical protein